MKIQAFVVNEEGQHRISVQTNEQARSIDVAPKAGGFGSSVNGGEMLFLALATCYCNDIYREAARKGIAVLGVEVRVEGEFGAAGEPARDVTYRAKVRARGASKDSILRLLEHTDTVAEVQNTLRRGVAVRLVGCEIDLAD